MNDIRRVLSYNDVLLCPRNSELDHISDANIIIDYDNLPSPFSVIPIVNAPMDTVCSSELIKYLTYMGMPTTIHRWFSSYEEQLKFLESCKTDCVPNSVFLAVGNVDKWRDWINGLLQYRTEHNALFGILVDVANGDTKASINTVEYVRSIFPNNTNIMAGNIATRSGFCRLQEAGANFIRCGIGGGSCCETRTATGFGIPTLTTVFDCAKVKESAYLIADGGIEYPGDICKAIAAGADMVMVGKMLAATDMSSGDKCDKDGNLTVNPDEYKFVHYRGMASRESINKLNSKKSVVSVEGVSGLIPYKGRTIDVVQEVCGNLRTAMSYYAGCRTWDEFRRKVKFVEITNAGWNESLTRVI